MAEKEIELLEKVELRLALAQTDQQLEKSLSLFLCPVLLKLESPHEVVRQKVMSILAHVNKRIRPNPGIKLPFDDLINLFCTDNVTKSPFVKNFTLIYLEIMYERLTEEEMCNNLPKLILNIGTRPLQQKQTLFHIILPALQKFKPPIANSPSELDPYNFKEHPADAKFLLESFLDVILYSPPSPQRPTQSFGQGEPTQNAERSSQIPPGLSSNAIKFVTNDQKAKWITKTSDLKPIKMGILRFVNSSVIIPDSLPDDVNFAKFFVLIVASCDPFHEIVSAGEGGLKRIKMPDLENKKVVDGLYSLYQGSNKKFSTQNLAQQSELREPASPTLKYKILNYLCKSRLATNTLPAMLTVAFDSLYGPTTNTKLQNQGMHFVQWVARMVCTCKSSASERAPT